MAKIKVPGGHMVGIIVPEKPKAVESEPDVTPEQTVVPDKPKRSAKTATRGK